MRLSDADYELANAFHDGELDRHAAAAFEKRVACEPALNEALKEISEVSRALGALRPSVAFDAGRKAPCPPVSAGITVARLGLAASLVIGVLAGASLVLPDRAEPSPSALDRHRLFVAQDYPQFVTSPTTPATHWIANVPDLSAARLTLVDVAGTLGKDFYFHYSGVNGCRLTFGIHADSPAVPPRQPDLLVRNWNAGNMHYSLFAVGMDRDRFDAVAAMLVRQTETGSPGDNSLLAVREATRTAVPCA